MSVDDDPIGNEELSASKRIEISEVAGDRKISSLGELVEEGKDRGWSASEMNFAIKQRFPSKKNDSLQHESVIIRRCIS